MVNAYFRFACVAIGFVLLSINCFAASKLILGAKGGIISSNVSGKYIENALDFNESAIGFSAGVFFGLDLAESMRIQTELLYVRKGTKLSYYDYMKRRNSITVKYDYLQLPVFIKLLPLEIGPMRPNIFFGAAPAVNIDAKQIYETANPGAEGPFTFDIDERTKDFEFGLVFGGGFDFVTESGLFTVELRYDYGLTSLSEVEPEINNQSLSISLSYAFNIGQL